MKYRHMNYRILLIALLAVSWVSISSAQVFTEEKKIVKSFKTNASTTIEVSNKYGRVQIIPWDKDSVRFEVDLFIKSDNLQRLQKVKNSIDFEFINTKYYILAKTNFEDQYNGLISELKQITKDFTDFFGGTQYQVKINYLVMIPRYINIKVENKYGDVYTDNLKGDITIDVSNGNFKANSLTGNSNIYVKFGNASINTINTGNFSISYAELEIKEADQLQVESKSSKITIDKINVLKTNSRRDKFYVTETNFLYGESSFTDLWVYQLNNDINFVMKYGNLNLESIAMDFGLINLDSKYAILNLFFEDGSGYSVDFNYKNTVLNYPEDISNIEFQPVPDEEKQFIGFGTIGQNQFDSKLKVIAESGNLNIYHRN